MTLTNEDILSLENNDLSIDIEKDYNNFNGIGLGLSLVKILTEKMSIKMECHTPKESGTEICLIFKGMITEEISTIKDFNLKDKNLNKCNTNPSIIKEDQKSIGNSSIIVANIGNIEESSPTYSDCNGFSKSENKILPIVLICDDSKVVRDSLLTLLKNIKYISENFCIQLGDDGMDVLSHVINDRKIKVVITDENMEFLNGSDAVAILRRLEQRGKVDAKIFISTTAFSDVETHKRIISAGFDDILIKPITKDMLVQSFTKLNIIPKLY